MSQMFRTTLRLDLYKPASANAAALLRHLHAERGLSYSALIVPAVNAYYQRCWGIDEALKSSDPMKRVGLMNLARAEAEQNVLDELIYT